MEFAVYGDDSKGLIKLDPRTKLFIFLISGTVSLHCYSPIPSIIYGTVLFIFIIVRG